MFASVDPDAGPAFHPSPGVVAVWAACTALFLVLGGLAILTGWNNRRRYRQLWLVGLVFWTLAIGLSLWRKGRESEARDAARNPTGAPLAGAAR
jgi:hypothetical protein